MPTAIGMRVWTGHAGTPGLARNNSSERVGIAVGDMINGDGGRVEWRSGAPGGNDNRRLMINFTCGVMEPLIYLTGSPPDPRSLELPDTSPAMPTTPLPKTPSMAIRALDSLRDSHLVPMSPRLEVSQPHSPKPDHEDERREAKADGDNPFPIDRNILRTVIREKLGCEPSHIKFLSSGTFHKAFLVSLVDGPDVVARIARRYMPKLKTESEIATINYVRAHTNIPVPFIYAYDSDPYNKLGGEYIIMSKAPGVPLIRHFHSMPANKMNDLLHNLAEMLVPLSQHTFPAIGSPFHT
ncbi:APH domain-containing protein [Rhizoctonia solani AG-1 IA]|uniref:APH domain-containing protein n=1 Tax=Thanatephorus cucumeris (strain AG1-IA) TaxID=983506 RepID=L8X250_THACA|nr:APH domain-containing protein [Rhizoctonia solani AG-1 IA]